MVASNSERVILLVQVPPTEDFNSLEHFKTCSHLKSFRTSENFVGSFASISLKTNMFLMNIYYNQRCTGSMAIFFRQPSDFAVFFLTK